MELPARLWPLAGVSLAAHGVALAYLAASASAVPPRGAVRPVAFETRILLAAAPPGSRAEVPAARLPSAAQPQPAPEHPPLPEKPVVAQLPPQARAAVPAELPALSAPAQEAEASAAAPSALAVADAPYLPRGELTVPPKLLDTVDVPFPDEVEGIVDLKVQLTLFIDEDGRVRRIRVDAPQEVHPAFERVIRKTWGEARFLPGELHQVRVRSQIRLEVDFEARGGRRAASG